MTMSTATKPTNADLAEQLAPPKAGWTTSEFWLTLVGAVLGVLVGLGVIGPDFAKAHEQLVNALALLGSLLAPGLYALSRGITKHAQTQAAAAVLNKRMDMGLTAEQDPQKRTAARRSSAGFALLALIGMILLVVGVILIIAAAAGHAHTFAPYVPGIVLAAVGLVLLWVDGGVGYGRRTTRL